MKVNNINIGELVYNKVLERGLTKAQFAKNLGIARQNVEKTIFSKHGLDTDLLCRICEVLDYNFFEFFTQSNYLNYTNKEVRATLTIEMGAEKQEKTFKLVFGNNKIEIK